MVRKTFAGRIAELQQDVLSMGAMVVRRLDGVIAAHADLGERKEPITYDDESVNQAWRRIEDEAVGVLRLQQPVVAGDLKLVTFTLVVTQELEHISDFARDSVYELNEFRAAPSRLPAVAEVHELMQLARDMLATSMDAFEQSDAGLARGLAARLVEVHTLGRKLPDSLRSLAWDDARAFEAVLRMVEVVNLWERIANHAAEIGERVVYLLTDEHEDLHSARLAIAK